MGLLDAYLDDPNLGESVTLKTRTGVNEYNEPTYNESTIRVVWFDDVRKVRDAEKETLQQFSYIQTKSLIQEGDAVVRDGYTWPIIGVQRAPTMDGEQFRIGNLGQRMV
jgi:hypothetical protein